MSNGTNNPPIDLKAKLLETLANLVILRITTIVGPVTASKIESLDDRTEIQVGQEAKEVAATTVNLLKGDVTNVMTPIFATDPNYRALHDHSVQVAKEVVSNNLALAKDAFLALKDFL